MSGKTKTLIILLVTVAIIFFGSFAAGFWRMMNVGKIPYNANLTQIDLPKTKIRFARFEDCGLSLSRCDNIDIYEIFSNGTGLQRIDTFDPARWSQEESRQYEAQRTHPLNNDISNGMGTYDGKAKFGDKIIEINQNPIRIELVLFDGDERIVLEEKNGIVPTLGIENLKWMPDGRHLLIEDNNRHIGIYDTTTRQYAYLTDGFRALIQAAAVNCAAAGSVHGLKLNSKAKR